MLGGLAHAVSPNILGSELQTRPQPLVFCYPDRSTFFEPSRPDIFVVLAPQVFVTLV